MNAIADEYDFAGTETFLPPGNGPMLDRAYWGYIVHSPGTGLRSSIVAGVIARFVGTILLLAAVGLWVLPDSLYGAEIFTMKLSTMVIFTVLGGYMAWVGRTNSDDEFQFDTIRGELRIGTRGLRGAFRLRARLRFDEISSVYMLRSKDHQAPVRLFLRVGEGSEAIEIGAGGTERLEALREILIRDLTTPADLPYHTHPLVLSSEPGPGNAI